MCNTKKCVVVIWMTDSMLKLNDAKTRVICMCLISKIRNIGVRFHHTVSGLCKCNFVWIPC